MFYEILLTVQLLIIIFENRFDWFGIGCGFQYVFLDKNGTTTGLNFGYNFRDGFNCFGKFDSSVSLVNYG